MSLFCKFLLILSAILQVSIGLDELPVDNTYKLSPSEKLSIRKAKVDEDFLRADSDKDGKLSQDEFPSRDNVTFDKMKTFFGKEVDKNGDGFVTLEEINNAKKEEENRQLKEQWNSTLQTHDENKDDALQMNELEHTEALRAFGIGANSTEIMERFDANHNGQIDFNEVGLREWSKTTFYEGNATDEEKKFTLYDKNKDGKLTFQEFNVLKYQNFYGSDEQAFRDHDANTDGFVTRKEYEARQKIEDTNVAENNIYVYDINRDQKLEKNETSALLLAYRSPEYLTFNFTKFDIDHNDGLNATELVSLTENVKMNNLKYGGGDQPTISPALQLQV